MKSFQVFPEPVASRWNGNFIDIRAGLSLNMDGDLEGEFHSRNVQRGFLPTASAGNALPLLVNKAAGMGEEAYSLEISGEKIKLQSGGAPGAFYGLQTLRQLIEQGAGVLPCGQINDAPALSLRGVLLDVGRGKIPTLDTLKAILGSFAAMKINHVQLYMEGYSFAWQQYAYLFSGETPLSAAEIGELVCHANSLFIDLVPCCNSLGHMEQWLEKPQLRRFAECEQGFSFKGLYHREPGTIDPSDPRAVRWAYSLLDELLDNFTSETVNVCLDEPFELGEGKNKALAGQKGPHEPYLCHVNAMYRYCRWQGKRMMMWADVLVDSPESIARLPKDVTLLHWMYEGEGRFAPEAAMLAASGLDFVLCPGTSSWCSFTGRSSRMAANVADAAACAIRYGAKGLLLTDWGDLGHWQYISASYIPFAFGAGYAWAGDRQQADGILAYCNRAVFKDESGRAAQIFYDMGDYWKYENAPLFSTTLCCGVMTAKHSFTGTTDFPAALDLMLELSAGLAKIMNIPIASPGVHPDIRGLRGYMQGLLEKAEGLTLGCADGALIIDEMRNACGFVLHGLALYEGMQNPNTGANSNEWRQAMFDDMDGLLQRHYQLWSARNKPGGYAKSTAQLLHLMRVYSGEANKEPVRG